MASDVETVTARWIGPYVAELPGAVAPLVPGEGVAELPREEAEGSGYWEVLDEGVGSALQSKRKDELVEQADSLGLDSSGTKADLASRIEDARAVPVSPVLATERNTLSSGGGEGTGGTEDEGNDAAVVGSAGDDGTTPEGADS